MPTATTSFLDQKIVLDHGTGARLSRELVEFVVEVLGDVYLGEMEDSAILPPLDGALAMTTDSFVVDPPFFGNGDIGKIAVCGTVNDLAVAGAEPRYLTLAMILESGFPLSGLHRALESVRDTAREAGIKIVAGDTKVVGEGEADGIFLNTTGVGVFTSPPKRMKDVAVGDKILLSGPIGDHTIHLLSVREGLGFEKNVLSDCAPLNNMIDTVRGAVPESAVRSMRDVTRGGLNAVLHEYASALGHAVRVEEEALPISFETAMAADMLGINPINCANEGCLALFVAPEHADEVLRVLRSHPYGKDAVIVGEVTARPEPVVEMAGKDGRIQEIEELQGAELPRLC
ncbi:MULTISPECIES: hydrogenase expression/formation protein HypE [unclassified Streptomyces]|uniref:Hydrogenase expression/formation protein n=1 Tax=Streptomyces atroolivaceus TaxID=66869 RepID=Q8GGQ7_STRAZ|nr:hydrogenase expression/formation protein HypE [Streptomyces sp. NBC_01445]AAN85508.1 hydrogenase expression/formation protein [Streptomyces atroolivaceus]WSE11681.1 hydrogenase expression/formation protein HypE [Streptomyces sp. NBC_01445]